MVPDLDAVMDDRYRLLWRGRQARRVDHRNNQQCGKRPRNQPGECAFMNLLGGL